MRCSAPLRLSGCARLPAPAFSRAVGAAKTTNSRREGRRAVCVSVAKNVEIKVAGEDNTPGLKEVFSVSALSRTIFIPFERHAFADGKKLFTASLMRPLGITLAEQGKNIVVDTVAPEGYGEQADIRVGDVLRGTTARSKNIKKDDVASVEARNKQSFLGGLILMKADGEDFDTVIAAIQSSKCASCDVTLVLERSE